VKTKIFFATDIHGSERCFIKFVNAGKVYKADVLILGGDITGKALVPIIKTANNTFHTIFLGEEYTLNSQKELETLEKKIRAIGYYPYVTTKEEYEDLRNNPDKFSHVFEEVACESVKRWVKIAEEKLKPLGIKCFISPGNDDIYAIDEILKNSDYIICPEGEVVYLDEKHEMISCGNSNITPWKCPRDISEEEIYSKIEKMVNKVDNIKKCVFNIHVPPYGTNIDLAPELDENLRPILQPGGGVRLVPVGSKAVRKTIEEYQPLLGLHGHIHESKGFSKIGSTLCVNPGSEYTEGILRGFLALITEKGIKDFIFTSG